MCVCMRSDHLCTLSYSCRSAAVEMTDIDAVYTALGRTLVEQDKNSYTELYLEKSHIVQWSVKQKFIQNGGGPRDIISPFHQSSVQSP